MPARVAVLDDDEATRELLASVLELEQYDTLLLQTPRGALEALAAYAPDLIILDLFFGHAPLGWDLLAGIRAHPGLQTVPVILCTAAGRAIRDHGEDLHAQHVWTLIKPFHIQDMRALIRTVLQP